MAQRMFGASVTTWPSSASPVASGQSRVAGGGEAAIVRLLHAERLDDRLVADAVREDDEDRDGRVLDDREAHLLVCADDAGRLRSEEGRVDAGRGQLRGDEG